jgi:hypothetical protein
MTQIAITTWFLRCFFIEYLFYVSMKRIFVSLKRKVKHLQQKI